MWEYAAVKNSNSFLVGDDGGDTNNDQLAGIPVR
jgi:hypothetical protein